MRGGDFGNLTIASEAGFVVLNLARVYNNADIAAVRLVEWDDHPNR